MNMRMKLPIIIVGLGAMSCAAPSGDAIEGASGHFKPEALVEGRQIQDRESERARERVQRPPIEDALPNLYLALEGSDEENVTVQLQFVKREGVPGPRAMELFIAHPENLVYTGVDSLPAVASADKKIIVQEKSYGVLRIIVYSSENTNRLNTGGLASLHFERRAGQGGDIVFASEGQVFAPVDANRGLLFGEALRVGR
jgi:hypothetical protein